MTVPRLEIETDIEQRLFDAGKMRKEMRKEIQQRNDALHVRIPEGQTPSGAVTG